MQNLSSDLARFTIDLKHEDIPEAARKEAKRFLLDSVGCALAGWKNEDMQAMHRFIANLGGSPQATMIASGDRTNAANATLMNSSLIRALDYNDIYWVQDPNHPSDLIGAALSAGEANRSSGVEMLTAIVLAYELEMRWCHAATPGIREVGWHHASLTQFVSPLVAGRLYGLDKDQLVAALGICGSSHFTLGGVVAGHLTNMKNLADPLAVQAGVLAAEMARQGVTGPEEVFEGKEGLLEVISNVGWDLDAVRQRLGENFIITDCSYKAFPTEALTHQPITGVLSLREKHSIDPGQIAEIEIRTTTRGADILSDPSKYQPDTKETADHSLPYVIAAAAADGYVLPESFSEEKLFDPEIRRLLPLITVRADPEIDALFPEVKRAAIKITLQDGSSYETVTDVAKGDPLNPLTDAELITKFRANASAVLDEAQMNQVVERTFELEQTEDITDYMQLLF
ncbi:MAG: MmgE/PrpD family protein [Anaerolineales bacterium]|nr:MmgE/PrpD family protein [Anaerolineales bacterium]